MKMGVQMDVDSYGVSIILEYILLVSILLSLTFIISLGLNDQLRESHTARVINNQFSDVASEISSQIVDIMTVAPRNGYLRSKIYMPDRIGDYDYSAGFKSEGGWDYVYIAESKYGKYVKYLGLGAATLNLRPEGFTHSLSESHEIVYTRISPIFPCAVLIVRPSVVVVNETVDADVEFDMSRSSAYGWWNWKLELWNKSVFEGDMSNTKMNTRIRWNETEIVNYCNYDPPNETAYCKVILTVSDVVYNLNDTDEVTLTITKNATEPELFIKKYVIPPQTAPGQPLEIHIYLQGRGFMIEERTTNLTVVHTLDTSGSMTDRTFYDSFSGYVLPNIWTITFNVNSTFTNRKIRIDAYTTDSMDPWYSGVDRDDAIRLRIKKPNGEQFYATDELDTSGVYGVYYSETVNSNELGNWTFKVIGSVPKNIDLHLKVYMRVGWSWNEIAHFSTNYTPAFSTNTIELPANYTKNDIYRSLWAYLNGDYSNDFFMWLGTAFCSNGNCTKNNVQAGSYTVYVTPRFADSAYYEGGADITKIDSARIAAITFNNNAASGDLVGIVSFNSSAYKHVVNSSPYLRYLTTNVENVTGIIKGLNAGGYTNFYDALVKSKEVIMENITYVVGTKPLIIMMSDGKPTTGITDPNAIKSKANEIKNTQIGGENISICTIAFGYDADEDLLRDIASPKPGGGGEKCSYTAITFDELVEAYRDIERAFRLAAKNVTITDVVPINLELIGSSIEIRTAGNVTLGEYEIVDTPEGKAIRLNVPEIYINGEVEIIFKVVANQPGDYQLDVPILSNVTYEPYPFVGNIETVNLHVLTARYSEVEKPTVKIS